MSNDNSGWQGQRPGGHSGSQSRYYDRYQQASGEPLTAPGKQMPGAPGGGGGRGLLLALLAVVVAVAVVLTVVIMKVAGGNDDPTSAVPTQEPGASAASPSTTPELSWTNPAASAAPTGARPLKTGWVATLADPKLASAAYDVPKKHWRTGGGLLIGFTDSNGKPLIATGHSASYREGFCKTDKGADLAFVGFYGVGQKDPGSAAPSVAQDFADAITLKKDNETHAHQTQVTSKQTTIQGLTAVESKVVANIGDRDHKSCDAAKDEIRTVAISMGQKTTVVVLVRAIGVPNALPEKEAEAILKTVRPAQN